MPLAHSYEEARIQVEQLVDRFRRNLTAYKRAEYKEEQVRVEFINPFRRHHPGRQAALRAPDRSHRPPDRCVVETPSGSAATGSYLDLGSGRGRDLPPPGRGPASLLEVERQILSIIEELHEMVGDGNDSAI